MKVESEDNIRMSRNGVVPISFAQRRLWCLHQLAPANPFLNLPYAVRLKGSLDIDALHKSLNEIARRHEILRTSFPEMDGLPVQFINPEFRLKLHVTDLSGPPDMDREILLARLLNEEARRTFDLAQGPPFRAGLLRLNENDHVMLLTWHHIIFDCWSLGVFQRELTILYKSFLEGEVLPLEELPLQYAAFADWQRRWFQGEILDAQLAYWTKQLHQVPAYLDLLTDRARPPVETFRGSTHTFQLPASLRVGLKEFSRRERATLFMVLLTAFMTLLHRYTGQNDIVVGTQISNRNRFEAESLIGFFVNTLVLRGDFSGEKSFTDALHKMRDVCLQAFEHQDLPFEKLGEDLKPERSLSRAPIFQVMFILQNEPLQPFQLSGTIVNELSVDTGTAGTDLKLSMIEKDDGLGGYFEFNSDLFDASTIQRMASYFHSLLEAIVANPNQLLSRLPLLSAPERNVDRRILPSPGQATARLKPERSLSATERQLLEIWQEILPVKSIGVTDNFFDIGGDSLLAVRLLSEIEKTSGIRLPMAVIFQAPIIEQLAAMMLQKDPSRLSSALIPIQPLGSKPPFFFVPGWRGSVFGYRRLVQYLGNDQPLYGVQAVGFDGEQAPYRSVQEIAAYCLSEFRKLQPNGPFYLCGSSFGGMVAFEIAQQLNRHGEKVALLALLDTRAGRSSPTRQVKRHPVVKRVQYHWELLTFLNWKEKFSYLMERATSLSNRYKREERNQNWTDDATSAAFERVVEANREAVSKYMPEKYLGRITLFRATLGDCPDPQLYWGPFAAGGLEIHDVPSPHSLLQRNGSRRILAKKLRDCLDRAQKESRAP